MGMTVAELAEANGWRYAAEGALPAHGTGLWEQVSGGVVRDKVSGMGWEAGRITGGARSASHVEQRGNVTITTSVQVSTPERSIDLGYLAITLPRRLPHMVLDATSNGRGMLTRPIADQALSLEGDFDRHFRLFVPKGYERDALYVFTPDLMALCIDEAGDLDIEIRDDQLIVYRPDGFELDDPATWDRLARIRRTVGATAWTQTELYLDERAPTPELIYEGAVDTEVAAGGRRLRRRLPKMLWIGVGIAVVAISFAVTVVTVVLHAVLR